MDSVVLFQEIRSVDSGLVGIATLNSERTLNALTLQMVDLLYTKMLEWQANTEISQVIIRGRGPRAFCAGGDVQELYRSIVFPGHVDSVQRDYCDRFFEREYRLDYLMHTYNKPIVCIGHGIVIGGGLGILSACSIRCVTPTSKISIPEVTIGLFPDAGASLFMKQLPVHQALFLGATGAQINAADAMALGIATHLIDNPNEYLGLLERNAYTDLNRDLLEPGNLVALDSSLAEVLPDIPGSVDELVEAIDSISRESPWAKAAVQKMHTGCPTTLGILLRQLSMARNLDTASTFRMEMTIASQCVRQDDFPEGVRALLIDKDYSPRWRKLDQQVVDSHFSEPWDRHPLEDLGA